MNVTIDQLLLLSRLFLGGAVLFLAAAAATFFLFDVRRAWRILSGKKLPPAYKGNKDIDRVTQKISTNDLLKEELRTRKLQMQTGDITKLLQTQYKGMDVTTALKDTQETRLLTNPMLEGLEQKNNKGNMMLDITFIHTEIIL